MCIMQKYEFLAELDLRFEEVSQLYLDSKHRLQRDNESYLSSDGVNKLLDWLQANVPNHIISWQSPHIIVPTICAGGYFCALQRSEELFDVACSRVRSAVFQLNEELSVKLPRFSYINVRRASVGGNEMARYFLREG